MKLEVGQRFELIADYRSSGLDNGGPKQGAKGTIKDLQGDGKHSVEMDKSFPGSHNCSGLLTSNKGWYLEKIYMKILDDSLDGKNANVSSLIKFDPKVSITDYVSKLLKKEKDKDRIRQLRAFQNCVLPKQVKDMINEALTVVLRSSLFEEWGINEHFEKGITNSLLIYGPPGTGKTMVTESIASILGKDLIRIDNGQLQSNVPGQTEKNITEAFKQAKEKDAVIMLDECDSILHNRNMVGAIIGSEINHFLSELERFDGVVVLTTNRLHRLDEALQRRVIAKIELTNPDYKGRVEIWEKLIPKKMPTNKLDYKRLGKPEMSGGEIKNAILLAARKAIARNEKCVTMLHFEESATSVLNSKKDFEECQIKTKDITQMVGTGGVGKKKVQA